MEQVKTLEVVIPAEALPVGIENLKKAIKFAIDLGQTAVQSGADGWQWTDIFGFIPLMTSMPGVIKTGPQILIELKDLTAEERNELNIYVSDNFNLPNDNTEKIIEDSLACAFAIVALITDLKPVPVAA